MRTEHWKASGSKAVEAVCRLAVVIFFLVWTGSAAAVKIACVGDSITLGTGASDPKNQGYPAVLQTLLGPQYDVRNFGRSGATLLKKGDRPYWNEPVFNSSTAFDPDVVVIMLGSNDSKSWNWQYKDDFAADYASLIQHYRGLGALVYVATPPPVYDAGNFGITPAVMHGEIVPLVRQIAADAGAPLIDVFTALSGYPSYFPDKVHPNADGYKLIAQTVAEALTQGDLEPSIGHDQEWMATRAPAGQNATPMSLKVFNAGMGMLNYTLTNPATWLKVTPTGGESGTGGQRSHTVSFITSNLPPGAYLSTVSIIAPDASEPLAKVPVAVRVLEVGDATNFYNNPIIHLGFNEGTGTVIANQGSAGGSLARSTPAPYWSTNVPAGIGGPASLDFQTTTGNYYIESTANYPQLAELNQFTVAGWVNCRDSTEGSGGNRLVTWINSGGHGVDVVYKGDGSVQVGINQWPDGSPARSSAGGIPTDADAGPNNWRFFAVTYDSTLAAGHIKFYFGSNGSPAAFDAARDYARGAVGVNISPLCIGHFNVSTRHLGENRMFRGLIDEVQVFDKALSLEEIQAVQAGAPPPSPEIRLERLGSEWLLLTWVGGDHILEEAPGLSGPWTPCPNQDGAQLIKPSEVGRFIRLQIRNTLED